MQWRGPWPKLQEGSVSLRPAFSEQPVTGARFVQDRIAAEGEEVWSLLEAGAQVYVCGDGARMAPAYVPRSAPST
ncbi:hypothetical protein GCM10009663_56140 [Kitasatospora arboriphila]|uniref:Oxidoreductase FAD/NAD(P)-binding domain-containing protein n=1 Tax=Kitasatospora arboriphila TaxID=258052 RepID=A0ABP4EIL8_9ACTN